MKRLGTGESEVLRRADGTTAEAEAETVHSYDRGLVGALAPERDEPLEPTTRAPRGPRRPLGKPVTDPRKVAAGSLEREAGLLMTGSA